MSAHSVTVAEIDGRWLWVCLCGSKSARRHATKVAAEAMGRVHVRDAKKADKKPRKRSKPLRRWPN